TRRPFATTVIPTAAGPTGMLISGARSVEGVVESTAMTRFSARTLIQPIGGSDVSAIRTGLPAGIRAATGCDSPATAAATSMTLTYPGPFGAPVASVER